VTVRWVGPSNWIEVMGGGYGKRMIKERSRIGDEYNYEPLESVRYFG
jgi:hypothetical protein